MAWDGWMHNFLDEPRLRGIEKGSPAWFSAQREIIKSRPLLRRSYDL